MTPHQRQAIREAIEALDFAAKVARIADAPEYGKMYEHAAEGLRLHCWSPAPGSLGDILIRTEMAETAALEKTINDALVVRGVTGISAAELAEVVQQPAPPSEEFLRNYAHHAAKT